MSKDKDKKDDAPEEEGAGGGKKKLLLIVVGALLVVGAGAYFLLFSGGGEAKAEAKPGTVLSLDPVAINLAGGSYLKIGLTVQFAADATAEETEDTTGSKALDVTIAQFSGAKLSDVQDDREAMKAALLKTIEKAYDDQVYAIYYTEYVTQ